MAKGSKMLQYKEVLNRLETESPGTKQTFYWGFLDKQRKNQPTATTMTEKDRAVLHPLRLMQSTHHRRGLLLLQDDGEGQDRHPTVTDTPINTPTPHQHLKSPYRPRKLQFDSAEF